jgi:excisionase family DNA binding protein
MKRERVKRPKPIVDNPRYLTKEQMAAHLQVAVRTLEDMMHDGKIPFIRFSQSLVRFDRETVFNLK